MTAAIETATPRELPATTRRRLSELFTREEIGQLTARSDLRGAWAVLSTWGVIAVCFAMVARWPGPLTVGLALILIAGRQLALAILLHEATHGTLFKSRWCNDVLVDWLCARPIWQDVSRYRTHHLVHHTKTGTAEDTDITLSAPFPIARAALRRKLFRDFIGASGLKVLYGRLLMDAGILKWTVANDIERLPANGRRWYHYLGTAARNMTPMLIANGLLFGILAACGHPALYALWVLAYITPFPLLIRIRSMAEHACTEKSTDMFRNTRTTRAGWLARMTVAPMRVNYHIEHHVMASVPYYRLPEVHRLLRARGALGDSPGYLDVLKLVSEPHAASYNPA
jgi:fatty acid desaturase